MRLTLFYSVLPFVQCSIRFCETHSALPERRASLLECGMGSVWCVIKLKCFHGDMVSQR